MATAPTTVPAAGPALPDPPSSTDTATFDARADAFFDALPAFQTDENALAANVYTNATATYDNAVEVAVNTAAVAANTALAAQYAGADAWVSGGPYALYDVVYSLLNRRLYYAIVANSGTTDPQNDGTNWAPVNPAQAALILSGLVQQGVDGGCYAFNNTTPQSAATNLLLYSLQFDHATYTKTSSSVTANATMSTTGDTDGDKIVEAAAAAVHSVAQTVAVAANVPYTFSVMVKAAGRNTVVLRMDKDAAGTDAVKATFDLTTGVVSAATNVGAGTGATGTSSYMGNGWYQCNLTGTPGAAAGTSVRCTIFPNTDSSYTGDGTSGVFVAEGQLETGTSATSRILTTTASAARAASVVAPSRLVFPLSPVANAWVGVFVANGIDTNIVDPNGSSLMDGTGPIKLDSTTPRLYAWQYVANSWRFEK